MRISISKLHAFTACRRAYWLKYIEGLVPIATTDALETGKSYHAKLEALNKEGSFDSSDFSKESAMAMAYQKYIYPHFKVVDAEQYFEIPISGATFVGIVDAIANDGHIVEHKSTSAEITDGYEYELQWNDQILGYMLATGKRKVWYTVCRKPTIRQKKGETDEAFFERMCAWYDDDTDSKIRLLELERTDDEVDEFKRELEAMADEMEGAKNFYRNRSNCFRWGRQCEYASVCLHYDPNEQYVEFERREGR